MANFLQKLVRSSNTSSSRILLGSSNLREIIPFLPKPTAAASSLIPQPDLTKPGIPLPPRVGGSPNLSQYQQLIFPNSPFWLCSSPVSSAGVKMSEEAEGDDEGMMRADSVKKKRKRKMNKHKYKKLRKRLRRKAK